MRRLLLLLAALAACDDAGEDAAIVEPSFDAKNDELGGVQDGGTLAFGGEASGAFDRDFQFFGYTFDAREGAEVTVEIAQKGSELGLDTTLFLYALDDGDDPQRIAVDDDGGFAALSRIDRFRLFASGRYVAVVGTKAASGRGAFRITLACDEGECGPTTTPDLACPGLVRDAIADCLQAASAEQELTVAFDDLLVDACGTDSELRTLRQKVCADTTAPYCDDDETIAACGAFARAAYPSPDRAIDLLHDVNERKLAALVDAARASDACHELGEGARCTFAGALFEYDAGQSLTLEELLAHARSRLDGGPGVAPRQDLPEAAPPAFDRFMSFFDLEAEAEALLHTRGLDLARARVATASGGFASISGDCEGDLLVVQFPDAGVVLELDVLTCSG